MYRVKISSKAIRKNQVKFAKMAQKAINISNAFDNNKLYKERTEEILLILIFSYNLKPTTRDL